VRFHLIAALTLAGCCSVLPAHADDTVTIHVNYQKFSNRVRPNPGPATAKTDFTLVLSGKNDIKESGTVSSGNNSISGSTSTKFNTAVTGGERTLKWRVAGPNKIVAIIDYPQNQQIQTISVNGKTCTINVVDRLKPGFTEYMLWSASLNQIAYYDQVKFLGGSCTIE
jgi:hypothetical protein